MEWQAQWIWLDDESQPLNKQVCFRKIVELSAEAIQSATIHISADTSFWLYVNGRLVGEGPIRSTSDHWYYESYSLQHILTAGRNIIAVQVFHSGHSTYQYVENRAGLAVQLEITQGGERQIIGTDGSWKARQHAAYKQHTVKRNANIGWLEIYDARLADERWLTATYDDSDWINSYEITKAGTGEWGQLQPRDIEPFAYRHIYPSQVLSIQEVQSLQQVVSLNMRSVFFPGSTDASAKIFSGLYGTMLQVDKLMQGTIRFAHSVWNGVQGRFKINDEWYKAGDPITLTAGRHLFLVEAFGVYNDVISHIMFEFPEVLQFVHPLRQELEEGESAFVGWGPFESIIANADGHHPVYGGVEKRSGLNHTLPKLVEAGDVSNQLQLQQYAAELQTITANNVHLNEMIYSLKANRQVKQAYSVTAKEQRLVYNHEQPTVIAPAIAADNDLEIIIDFGKLYVGNIVLDMEAPADTVVDVYGFEAYVNQEIRYTSGLNNAFRYISNGGRQQYRSISRMGFRYLIITLRANVAPVSIYRVYVEQSGYPVAQHSTFRCSDAELNAIWEISRHTSEVCTEDTFVDCPTFERVFWVGDCRVSALVNYHLSGSYELVKHSLEMVPRSSNFSPLLLSCMPTDWQSVIPMWTFSWMMSIADYVTYSGDTAFERTIYEPFKQTIEEYYAFLNEDGLLDISSWNLVDWAELDIPYVGIGTAQHGALAYCCRILSEIASRLGEAGDAASFASRSEQMKRALHAHLWNEEQLAYTDGRYREGHDSTTVSQQTHVLLYLYEMLDERVQPMIEQKIIDPPTNWVPIISPFMSFYLFEAWSKLGQQQRIIERIKLVWGTMVEQGSSTAWETYPQTRSFAHAWSAAPCYVLSKELLGITAMENGFKRLVLSPPAVDSITWAEGTMPTPYGKIDIRWNSEDKQQKKMHLTVPQAIMIDLSSLEEAGWQITLHHLTSNWNDIKGGIEAG